MFLNELISRKSGDWTFNKTQVLALSCSCWSRWNLDPISMHKPGGTGLVCGTVLVLSEIRIKFGAYKQDNLKDATDAFLDNLCPAAPNP